MNTDELSCKKCGALIEEHNIARDLEMARCTRCGAVFDYRRYETSEYTAQRPAVPIPEKFDIGYKEGMFTISYKWFSYIYIFLIFFALIWNGFLVFWHYMALKEGIWFMSAFASLHTAIGVGLVYYSIAGFLNITEISVGKGLLKIRHRPLPWFGIRNINAIEIKQIYCKESLYRGRNSSRLAYRLYAVKNNGRQI